MAGGRTPRPVPKIQDELTFSRKKRPSIIDREIVFAPRSPIKSGPPVSRIFRHRKPSTPGALAVSFRQSQVKGEVNIQSPLYTSFDRLYFDQCFTKLSILGTGSFGEVWKVQSKEDGKLYAIKKSRDRFRGDFDRKQRLEEVNKNELIQGHPNCVHFYKAWEEQDHLYIQSELCEMSLKDYAENVPTVEEKEIWNMIVDLCHGLKHLHDTEFAHMDIKPANLFLGRDGLYQIGDFGLVVELTRDLTDAMDGDAKYMAPELMEGNFSKAADIFSLGIALLELACSLELSKGGLLWHQLRNNQLPFEFTQGLSDDLILLITQMMDSNPNKRPTVDDILNMPSVIQAQQKRQNISYASFVLQPIHYLFMLICELLSHILSFFKPHKRACLQLRSITPPPVPLSMLAMHAESNVGHESLVNQSNTPNNSPYISANQHATVNMVKKFSPFYHKQSPLFQPVSNKRDTELWRPSSPENRNTPINFCSSPYLADCSPPSAPVSDRIVRSRLFTCSSDEDDDIFDSRKIPKNLMNSFIEDQE